MSEFQYVGFRAIDKPVSGKDLEFMRKQSSRAEVTAWSFDNEYHYGDFGGDAAEMLRRGYDIHLHYANFGIRTLMIRLPNGLPDPKAAEPYLDKESLKLLKDKHGPGQILCLSPYHEPGDLDELWDLDRFLDRLPPLRAEILEGDLRPFYLAHLAVARDGNHDPEAEKDTPVPAGLDGLTDAQQALAELYQLSEALIAAAARGAPPLPATKNLEQQHAAWLERQPQANLVAWLGQWMADPHAAVRAQLLAKFRTDQGASSWPTVQVNRTIAELESAAESIQRESDRQKAETAARRRAKKLADMAADPKPTLRETERLVKQRSRESYEQIAALLSDLREALGGAEKSNVPDQQAQKLRAQNPKLHLLTGALRRRGFLKKTEQNRHSGQD